MKPVYMDGKTEARIGDVVMMNAVRGIVIGMAGTFVNVLLIGTKKDTGKPLSCHNAPWKS
jgi:hypothetical protein